MLSSLLLDVYTSSLDSYLQILPVIIILLIIVYMAQPTQMHIKNRTLQISGFYGKNIDFGTIKNVQLSDSIPRILLRTNGLGLGPVKKGYFRLEGVGKCCLFLNGQHSPYLIIETIHNEIIIVNNKDEEYIRYVYSTIRKNL